MKYQQDVCRTKASVLPILFSTFFTYSSWHEKIYKTAICLLNPDLVKVPPKKGKQDETKIEMFL
jgi:hypothetical protein